MQAGYGRLHRRWGRWPDSVSGLCKKKGSNPQIGLGGVMHAGLRGLLELLLGNNPLLGNKQLHFIAKELIIEQFHFSQYKLVEMSK
jgi:hypothetical protein